LFLINGIQAQAVGIGTATPDHKIHVAANTSGLLKLDNTTSLNVNVSSDMYFKTGTHYTGALKTIGTGTLYARLGLFTYASTVSSGLLERMSIMDDGKVGIGTTSPAFLLDVNGRMRVRNGGGSAGILFMDAANVNNRGFVGMKDDYNVGFYGYNGGGWGLTMNVTSGSMAVTTNGNYNTATFNSDGGNGACVLITPSPTGTGLQIEGGLIGITASSEVAGPGYRIGIEAYGAFGADDNTGVYGHANGGVEAKGIYGKAYGASSTNWAGYFVGSVYTNGSYQGSDRKLKSDIHSLDHAIQLIKQLKPSTYTYKTAEYAQMELPQGQQYGLIADEVKQVFPSMVKKAVQPAEYENNDRENGRMIAEKVEFEAVNYTAMIPVLIAAMQEQQAMIDAQQKKIEELEAVIGKQ
jgi:hypothetical protein